jgi:hypothetical protein
MCAKVKKQIRIMTVSRLQQVLAVIERERGKHFEVWLSSDEEGNLILPMAEDLRLSLEIDDEQKHVTLFPVHI